MARHARREGELVYEGKLPEEKALLWKTIKDKPKVTCKQCGESFTRYVWVLATNSYYLYYHSALPPPQSENRMLIIQGGRFEAASNETAPQVMCPEGAESIFRVTTIESRCWPRV